MKHVLLIIIIILILPYHSFSNEYIIIRVCKAISGCAVNTKTGECPQCVDKKITIRLMVHKRIDDNHYDNDDTHILNFIPLEELCELCYWRK